MNLDYFHQHLMHPTREDMAGVSLSQVIFNSMGIYNTPNTVHERLEPGSSSDSHGSTSSSITIAPKRHRTKCTTPRYFCPICSKGFSQKLHLHGHLLAKHKNVPNIEQTITSKIHYCTYCEFRTINTYNLTSHLKTKHGKIREEAKHRLDIQQCLYCKYSTHNKGNLFTHMRRHGSNKFLCSHCNSTYNQYDALKKHCLKMHGIELTRQDVVTGIKSEV